MSNTDATFPSSRSNCDGLPCLVYILESRFLAAEYIRSILIHKINLKIVLKDLSLIRAEEHIDKTPCVVILDYSILSKQPQQTLRALKNVFPCSECVLLGDKLSPQKTDLLIHHECFDFVTYTDVPHKLAAVIDSAANSPRLTPTDSSLFGERYRTRYMTKREREIVELVQCRLSNKEIANKLNIAEVTVKFHLSNIFSKAKVAKRRELFSIPKDELRGC